MSSMLLRDARIPVRFGTLADAGPESALLIEGDVATVCGRAVERFVVPAIFARHPAGCPCCAPRTEAARALSRLFLARARNEVGYFREVVAVVTSAPGEIAVTAALQADPLVSAWFWLAAASRMSEPRGTDEDHRP